MKLFLDRSGITWLLAAGLILMGCAAAPRPAFSQALRAQSGPYELEVLANGSPVRSFTHAGETHILGTSGARYVLRIHNRSARRVEAVVSVDGLDVMDGKPGDYKKRGYLIPAYGSVDIDGWRLSDHEAAAFRFAAVSDSYAAKTGKPRNIGVIGAAIFPERRVRRPAPVRRRAFRPHDMNGMSDMSDMDDASGWRSAPGSAPAASGSAPPSAEREAMAPRMESSSADEGMAQASRQARPARKRSGLGTEFGEAVGSEVREVAFTRDNASAPAALLGARYNDRQGLIALGIDVDCPRLRCDADLVLRQSANPFPVSDRRYASPPAGWRRD